MKKHIFVLFTLLSLFQLEAQTAFTFETTVPAQWSAGNGILSINTEHYKEGLKSLRWQTTGQSVITITPTAFTTSTTNSVYFQLYTPSITNDEVKVDFYNGKTLVRSMLLVMNFKGWREVCRGYTEFASTSSVPITVIKITLTPSDNTVARTLYFDDFKSNMTTPTNRVIGTHWIKDNRYFPAEVKNNLLCYSYPIDIVDTTATYEELKGVVIFKNNSAFKNSPRVGSAAELAAATTYVQSLNIIRNSDGSVRGNPISLRAIDTDEALFTQITRNLEVLAGDPLNSRTLFNDLLDFLLDQGLAEGVEFEVLPNHYSSVRTIPLPLLNILPSCSASQKVEVLKLVKWLVKYGDLYLPNNVYLSKLNSDIIYNYCGYFVKIALSQTTNDLTMRELKAFKRYLDRSSEYTPGGKDIFKPDGTGFHHNTHHPSYMYAYSTYAQYMYYLMGTPFHIEKPTYERFKKAIISFYLMGNNSTTDPHFVAPSLRGRSTSMGMTIIAKVLENMVSVGSDLYGTQDNEIAAAYNYFNQSSKYIVNAPADYTGFYSFNYSPIGVYRQPNWVATMRAPTTRFWGSEIYANQNRLGRYQSHGTLEILYNNDPSNSGYPADTDKVWGGWDWNVIPGTTTVRYTSWSSMMPNANLADRFDQFTKTKDFAGALSWGDFGLFAADFDQLDTWGSQRFTPTNLVFKKTVLAIDQLLIDMGTNISSSGTYSSTMTTTTNLFQNIINSSSKPLEVNGSSINSSYSKTWPLNSATTILTPVGTGFVIPKGNDELKIMYGTQSSPLPDGSDVSSPTISVVAAKAYLNHGVKPTDKSYQFVALPAATAQSLTDLATKVNDGSLYQVLSASSSMHALWYKPRDIFTYTFFQAVSNISFGIVTGISTEALLMLRKSGNSNSSYDFAIANPNLKPTIDTVYNFVSNPTTTIVSLAGNWKLNAPVDKVTILSASSLETKIQIELSQGEPRYFTLVDAGTSSTSSTSTRDAKPENIKLILDKSRDNLRILFNELQSPTVQVTFISLNGISSNPKDYTVVSGILNLDHPPLNAGVNILKIKADGVIKVVKLIF